MSEVSELVKIARNLLSGDRSSNVNLESLNAYVERFHLWLASPQYQVDSKSQELQGDFEALAACHEEVLAIAERMRGKLCWI